MVMNARRGRSDAPRSGYYSKVAPERRPSSEDVQLYLQANELATTATGGMRERAATVDAASAGFGDDRNYILT